MAPKADKVDLTFAVGWVRGRLAAIDETTGESDIVAGVHFRVRVEDIRLYSAGPAGVVVLWIAHMEEPMEVIGSVSTLDKIMERAHLRSVPSEE